MKDHVGPMERPRLALANRVIQSGKKTIKKQLIILPLNLPSEKSLTGKSKYIVLVLKPSPVKVENI